MILIYTHIDYGRLKIWHEWQNDGKSGIYAIYAIHIVWSHHHGYGQHGYILKLEIRGANAPRFLDEVNLL